MSVAREKLTTQSALDTVTFFGHPATCAPPGTAGKAWRFQVGKSPKAEGSMTTLPLMVAGGLGTWGGGACKWGGTREGLGTRLCQVPTAKRLIRWESGIQPPRRSSKSPSIQPACEGGLSLSPGQASSLPTTGKKGTSRSPRFRKCKLPRAGGAG